MKPFYQFRDKKNASFFLLYFVTTITLLFSSTRLHAQCGAGDVGGKVFMDLPMNGSSVGVYGVKASNEPGIIGVSVKITDSNGTITNKTTDASGNWYVDAPVFPVKIEFTWKTAYPIYESSPNGTNSKTSIQIINASTCSADFALHDPVCFTQSNPYIATTCFVGGTATGTAANDPAIVTVRYNSTGLNSMYSNYNGTPGTGPTPLMDATISQVGSVYGLAYQKNKKRMFFSTFLKRHVGILDGPGYIYVLNYTTNPATYLTKFNLNGVIPSNGTSAINFGTVCRSGSCGSPASDYTLNADKTQPSIDIDAYGKVGKIAFGDIDMGPDGKTLFAINLFSRSIITVDVSGNTLPGTVKEYLIDGISGMPTSTKGVLRPFALEFYNGKGYLGITDDASISKVDADLKCYVLEFDPANPAAGFTQKLSFDPNARRGSFSSAVKFHYWNNTYVQPPVVDEGYFLRYTQPILSDIEFDQYGTMFLSIMDRHGHQIGSANRKPLTGNTDFRTVQAFGEILKACNTSTGFVLEGGTGCTTTGAEFFNDDSGDGAEESIEGASTLIKGSDQIMTINFDPFPGTGSGQAYWNTQGMNTYSTTTGATANWYSLYYDAGGLFGKANGLGDLEVVANEAPIEIGNRVWKDIDEDGIQDASEPSLVGITVKLYDNSDVELASTTTDGNGQYIFSSATIATLLPNTNYKVKITTLGTNASVTGLTLTNISPAPGETSGITNTGATTDNSDAFLVSSIPTILIKTADAGVNNHTYDFGFKCKPTADAGADKALNCTTTSAIIGTAAVSGYTYAWSPTTNLSSSTAANPTASPNVTTTYILTVTSSVGCTATDAVVVTVDKTAPSASIIGSSNLTCATTSVTRTATGGGSGTPPAYLWSNDLGTNAIANITAVGTYTVTVTSANGCTATASTTVGIDNPITWAGSYGTYSGYCSSNYQATQNNSFYTDIAVPATASSVKFNFRFGTHNYSANSSYVRIEAPIGTVIATYNPVTGDIVDTNGGCLQARELTANNPSGNTSIRITVFGDDNWAKIEPTCFSICNLSATVNVTQPACGQTTGSIAVTAPSGASAYQYKNGSAGTWQSGSTFSGLINGNYDIYIRDANNTTCEKLLGSYTITAPIVPTATITGSTNLTCSTTSVTRTASGGGTYLWSNNLGTNASVTISAAGTYTVTVTSANGCSATATTLVTIDNSVPTASISGNNNLTCATTSVTRTASGGGTYLWSNNLGTSASVTISAAGTYTVTVTSANGCSATATTLVTIDNSVPTPSISGSNNLTCATTSVSRTASGGGTYLWSNNLGTSASVTISAAGTYMVTVTSANGCSATATTLVTIDNSVPTASISGSNNLTCATTSVSRTASGGGTYLWSNNLGTNAAVTISAAGTYTVTVTSANGCSATATTLVTIDNSVPTPSISGSNNLTCATTSVSRTASGGGTYLWSNNLGTSASVTISAAGTYTVTVTSANGCSATATTLVTIDNSVPTASISGSNNLTCATTSVSRTASGGGTYLWSNNLGTNPSVTISAAGTYTVTVTSANGCTATATTLVTIDNSVPTPSISGSNNLTCATTSVSRTASGGGTYLWSNNLGTSASVTISAAGTYMVTVTSANGCSATATTLVTIDNSVPTPSISGSNNLTCATTSVSRTASGGGSYSWSNNLGTNASVTISAAGTYTVTVTSANGCSATATTLVTIDNSVPTPSISGSNNLTCATTSVTRTASGGGTYLWSNNLGTSASVTISASGTYTVTVTSANGCTATATTLVTIDNSVPTPSISGSNNLTCATTSVTRTASGGGTYLWSNNLGTNASVTISAAGTYTVTVTSANGCSATATTLVTIDNSVPTASISGSNNLTCATTSVTRTASGGGTYLWSNNLGTSASVTISAAGTYMVTVTSANGCSATATTLVTIDNSVPTPSISGSNNLTCATTSVTRTASGGGTYLWSNNLGTNASVTISAAGTYTVTVTSANGCSATATTLVTIDNSVPTASISGSNNLTCATTSVTRTASGGGSYSWSNNLGTNASVTISAAGTYTVTVTAANGCTATATTLVTIDNSVPTPSISGSNNLTCATTSVSRTASGGGTYLWSNNLGTSASVTISAAGTYTVTVTSANGCTATATTLVTIDNSVPTPSISGSNNLTCATTSVSRTASGGGTYLWSNNLGTNASVTISAAGTYTVTVTSANGCSATATTLVTSDSTIPQPTTASAEKCGEGTLTLSATGCSGTYNWYASSSSNTILATTASFTTPIISITSIYYVSCVVGECTSSRSTATATINDSPSSVTASSNSPVKEGNTINLSASSIGGVNYTWSGPNSFTSTLQNPTISNSIEANEGVYSVTITSNKGCTSTATTQVIVFNFSGLPDCVEISTVTANSNSPITSGNAINLSSTATNAIAYEWTGPFGFNSTLQNPTIPNASPVMAGIYTVTVTADGICSETATANVIINCLSNPLAGSNAPICVGNTLNLTASGGSGTPPVSYAWSGPNGFTSTLQNPTIVSAISANQGVYTVTITGANGCTATVTANVVINPLPTASISGDSNLSCSVSSVSRTASGGGSYSWSNNLGTNSSVTISASGTYTVTVTSTNGCTATATTFVTIDNSVPTASISGTDNLTCATTSVTRTASGGGTYLWSNNLGTNASVTISTAGTYTVTVTSANGCSATATTVVSQDNSVPNASISGSNNLTCAMTSVTRTASGGGTYLWSNNLGTNASVTISTAGTYTVTVTSANGCSATATTVVSQDNSVPTASISGSNNLTCATTSVTRTTSGGGTYLWSNNLGTNASVTISAAGTYTVTVTSANGCSATATTVVSQDNSVPNAEAGSDKTLNCTTSSVTIGSDAVIPNATYSWSPSIGLSSTSTSLVTASPSATTTYILTVTNNTTGCSATDAVVVTVDTTPPSAAITGTNNLTCTVSSVTRTASGGGSYSWSNNLGTSASVTISAAGTYTVTVTSTNGCTATATTLVTTDLGIPTVTISATDDTLTCNKTQATLTAIPLPASTYTYLWSNGTTFSNITVYDAGTYSVEVTAENGCKASASIVIAEFNTVTAIVDVTQVLCKGGNTGKITITGLDGIAPYQFKLGNGAFQSANEFTGLTLGNYAVTILDAGGCTASINVTVTEPLVALALTVTPTNLKCNAGNDGKIVATATGGTPAYTFSINAGSEQSSDTFNSLAAGAYTITAYDSHGCAATATTTLTQPSPITVTATGTMIDCSTPKGTVTAVASGGTPTYQYAIDGTTFQASNTFANLNSGTYTITVKDINACLGTTTAAVTVGDTTKPTFIATATMATCTAGNANNDGKITIENVVNGTNYQYSEGATFNSLAATPAVATIIPVTGILSNSLPNPSGNSAFYTIRVYSNNNCYKDVTVELLKRVCACKTDICVPYSVVKTKSKNIN